MKAYIFLFFTLFVFSQESIAQFHINGTAYKTSDRCYTLTNASNGSVGSIWDSKKIDLRESFDVNLEVFLGCKDDDGADGMVFGFQPVSTSVGQSGGGIGFEGVRPSLGIEMDTYQNYSDPSFDHIAIIKNGNMQHDNPNTLAGPVAIGTNGNVEDCRQHNLKVRWNANTYKLEVWFDCVLKLSYTGDIVNDIFNGDPFVFWGFTAATGGANNKHSVCINYTTFLEKPSKTSLCAGESVQLNVAGGTAYRWTPTTGLSNSNIANPIAQPTQTTTYTVAITDKCGETNYDITLKVSEPIKETLEKDASLCEGDSLKLDVSQSGATSFAWSNGSNSPIIYAKETGLYKVTLQNGTCTGSDFIRVAFAPRPIVELGNDSTLCAGDSVKLDVSQSNAQSVIWSDGSTSPILYAKNSGAYKVTLSNGGCSVSDLVNMTFTPYPQVELGKDSILCDGDSLRLDVSQSGAEAILWSNGSNESVIYPKTAGLYKVNLRSGNCSISDSIQLTFNKAPQVDLGKDSILCEGDSMRLDVSKSSAQSILWSDGSTEPVLSAKQTGIYAVKLGVGMCYSTDSIQLGFNPPPQVELGKDSTLCEGDSLRLDVSQSGAAVILWSTGSNEPVIYPKTAGVYKVNLQSGNCSSSDSIQLTFNKAPQVDLGKDSILCEGDSMRLDVSKSSAQSILWSDGSTEPVLHAKQAGVYKVKLGVGLCYSTDSIQLGFNPPPQVELGKDSTLCEGDSLRLDVSQSGAAVILWSNGSTTPVIYPKATGLYKVSLRSGNCSSSDSIQLTFNTTPRIDLGKDSILCEGDSMRLDVSKSLAQSILWSDGSTEPVLYAKQAGVYNVKLGIGMCYSMDSIQLGFNPPPQVELGKDSTLCEGDSLRLDVSKSGAAVILWSNSSTMPVIYPKATGLYKVSLRSGKCTASDSIQLTFNTTPRIDLGKDSTLCEGDSLKLDVSKSLAQSILWSNGSTNPVLYAKQTGLYKVKLSIGICSSTDSIQLGFNFRPQVELGKDSTLCEGDSLKLDASKSGAQFIQWSNNSTNSIIFPKTTGLYKVDLRSGNCSASDSIRLIFNTTPRIDLGKDSTLCEGDSLKLDVSKSLAQSILWSNGSTNPVLYVKQTGLYKVKLGIGICSSTDSIQLGFNFRPQVELGKDSTLCEGDSLKLDASKSGAQFIQWSNNSTNSIIYPKTTGLYKVNLRSGNCSASDSIRLTFSKTPKVELGNDSLLCEGDSMRLDVSKSLAQSILWSNGSTNPILYAKQTGTYKVKLGIGMCYFTDSIQLGFNSRPQVELGKDSTLCEGDSLKLDVSKGGAQTILWSNGSTSSIIYPKTAGLYKVVLRNGNCAASDSVRINVDLYPNVDLGKDSILCEGEYIKLDVSKSNAQFILWSDGSTNSIVYPKQSGLYKVQLRNGNCITTDSIRLDFNTKPQVELGKDSTLCEGDSLKLDASQSGAQFILWSNGSTEPVIYPKQAGFYKVNLRNGVCVASDSIRIKFIHLPYVQLGNDTIICENKKVVLKADIGNGVYKWQDGSTQSSYPVTKAGTYSITVSNQCGRDSASVEVKIENCYEIYIPNVFSPNEDLYNDVFMVYANEKRVKNIKSFQVFDRWGSQVFEKKDFMPNNPEFGWNGAFMNKPLENDVFSYWVEIEFVTGETVIKKGDVTLLR